MQYSSEITSLRDHLRMEEEESDRLRRTLQNTKEALEQASHNTIRLPQLEKELNEKNMHLEVLNEQVEELRFRNEKLQKSEELCRQYQVRLNELQEQCNSIPVCVFI